MSAYSFKCLNPACNNHVARHGEFCPSCRETFRRLEQAPDYEEGKLAIVPNDRKPKKKEAVR